MRRTHFTVLLVCEGDAEDQLARTIRDLYLPRGCGTVLQRRNARGFGGAGALRTAIESQGTTGYNVYGVMVDTDRHWADTERALAHEHGITVIEHHPCLEAMLLEVAGRPSHRKTSDNKAAFEAHFGSPAHRDGLIERHFNREMFDQGRSRITSIDVLLRLIRC